MSFKFTKVAASFAIAAISSVGFAATDGVLDSTASVGSTDITLEIVDQVQISALADIILADNAGAFEGATPACIYRNGTGAFNLQADGDGAAGVFTLTDGTNTIPYTVALNDGTADTTLTTGTPATGLTGADTGDATCGGTPGHSIKVAVAALDAAAATSGTYSGTLTLTVAPE